MFFQFHFPDGRLQEFELSSGEYGVGRSESNAVVLIEDSVSRKHAVIKIENEKIYLTDLGGANGVMVSGERIERLKPIEFHSFLPVAFGNITVTFSAASQQQSQAALASLPELAADVGKTSSQEITKPRRPIANSGPKTFGQESTPARVSKKVQKRGKLKLVPIIILLAGAALVFISTRPESEEFNYMGELMRTGKRGNDGSYPTTDI